MSLISKKESRLLIVLHSFSNIKFLPWQVEELDWIPHLKDQSYYRTMHNSDGIVRNPTLNSNAFSNQPITTDELQLLSSIPVNLCYQYKYGFCSVEYVLIYYDKNCSQLYIYHLPIENLNENR